MLPAEEHTVWETRKKPEQEPHTDQEAHSDSFRMVPPLGGGASCCSQIIRAPRSQRDACILPEQTANDTVKKFFLCTSTLNRNTSYELWRLD